MAGKLTKVFSPILVIVIAFSFSYLWLEFKQLPFLADLEQKSIDFRFQYRDRLPQEVNVVYLVVDNDAIENPQFGPNPWHRGLWAMVIEILNERSNPEVIGFDYVFAEAGHKWAKQGNRELFQAVKKYPNCVFAAAYTYGPGITQEFNTLPLIRDGFMDPEKNDIPVTPDPRAVTFDGKIGLIEVIEGLQEIPVYVETVFRNYYTMGLMAALAHWGLTEENVRITEARDYCEVVDDKGNVLTRIPLEDQQVMNVNWHRSWNENQTASLLNFFTYHSILVEEKEEGREEALKFFERFNDAIVFVGPADTLSKDLSATPLDHLSPRVATHGQVTETIIEGKFLKSTSLTQTFWISLALSLASMIFLLTKLPKYTFLLYILYFVMLTFYFFYTTYAFEHLGLILPFTAPYGAAISCSLLSAMWAIFVGDSTKRQLEGYFKNYVSPELVNQMVEKGVSPRLGGDKHIITAFFTDVASFSSIAEKMEAKELVLLMNEYLGKMTDVIYEHSGTLDKYIGDAIVAFFGAPLPDKDHAKQACFTAAHMIKRQKEINEEWKTTHPDWPPMLTRIGLNSGDAIVGNMGSGHRFNYTMMGDTVNLAARCESGAKKYGIACMVSEAVLEHAGNDINKEILFRRLDRIIVVGKSTPTVVYEIVGFQKDTTDEMRKCIEYFEEGFELYSEGEWDGALAMFHQSYELEENSLKNPSIFYIERVNTLKMDPPTEWEGVWRMDSK